MVIFEDGTIGRGGMGLRGRIRRSKTHVLPFTDHAGKEALMVFVGPATSPLPKLYNFAFYFTHENVNPGNVQPAELLKAVTRHTPLENYPCPYRLDIYFLPMPSAKVEECDEACIAHYLEEKRRRGEYMRQIEAFEASIGPSSDDSTGRGCLPGFVPDYIQERCAEYHRGLLYSYQAADWRTDKQLARKIRFDAIPWEENGSLADEVKETEVFAPVQVALQPIQHDGEGHGPMPVGECMFYVSNGDTQNFTEGPWQEAEQRGWSTWQE